MISDKEYELISQKVKTELVNSINKYDWKHYSKYRMFWVIVCEMWELLKAIVRQDIFGNHGVYIESSQVSACCQKMMMEVLRRI